MPASGTTNTLMLSRRRVNNAVHYLITQSLGERQHSDAVDTELGREDDVAHRIQEQLRDYSYVT